MKQKIFEKYWGIIIFTALAICAVSCSKDEPDQEWSITPQIYGSIFFSGDGLSISFGAGWQDESSVTFTVTAPKKASWDVISTHSWVHIAKTENGFTLSVYPTNTVPERATVSVVSGEEIIWARLIEQEAALRVNPVTPVVFSLQGGNKTFRVTTSRNKEWNAISSQSWLSLSKNNGAFTLSAAANTSSTPPPPATVTVSSGTATPVVIDVTQEGPVLTVTPVGSSLVFSADGQSATLDGTPFYMSFYIYSNATNTWGISSSVNWVDFEPSSIYPHKWDIYVTPNTIPPRTAGNLTIEAFNTSLPPVIISVSQLQW
jgi:hypothetical protein